MKFLKMWLGFSAVCLAFLAVLGACAAAVALPVWLLPKPWSFVGVGVGAFLWFTLLMAASLRLEDD